MRLHILLSAVLLAIMASAMAQTPLHVVASITDLAAVAREIGGDRIEIESLCSPDRDPHSLEVLPSYMVKIQHADIYLKVGLGLDQWADGLIASAENSKLMIVDCSHGVLPIKDADDSDERGHLHAHGNPHYWLSPSSFLPVAQNIRDALIKADPENQKYYAATLMLFTARLDSAFGHWKEVLSPFRGAAILTYHESWPYFARDFGLEIVGIVESKPGVAPSPAHLAGLEATIRSRHTRVLIKEPYFSDRTATLLHEDTGIAVFIAPSSVGGILESTDIFSHFDYLTSQLATRLGSP